MNREQAWAIVEEFVKSESLRRHLLAVEACMRYYAEQFGEDPELWGVTGLLHDFDWEIHPNMEEHPIKGVEILRQRGVPEVICRAILSHAPERTGVQPETRMEKALRACDDITGFIVAVALVRPSKSLYDLKVKSVKKKWKDKSFAAGVKREEVREAAEALGLDLWEHVANVIEAMRGIAPQLGLDGSLAEQE